jgi:hypothetical protein
MKLNPPLIEIRYLAHAAKLPPAHTSMVTFRTAPSVPAITLTHHRDVNNNRATLTLRYPLHDPQIDGDLIPILNIWPDPLPPDIPATAEQHIDGTTGAHVLTVHWNI